MKNSNEDPFKRGTLTYSHPDDYFIKRWSISLLEYLTGRKRLEKMYKEVLDDNPTSEMIWSVIFDKLELQLNIKGSLSSIQPDKPTIFIANHPFGVVDGIILGYLISMVRPKFKFLVNEVLCREELLEPYLLPIDFNETKEAVATNIKTREISLRILSEGEALAIFPAGGVATATGIGKKVEELEWKKFVGKLILKSDATIIPIYFHGQNSFLFQLVSQFSQPMRLGLLLNEVRNKIGKKITVSIGESIELKNMGVNGHRNNILPHLYQKVHELKHYD